MTTERRSVDHELKSWPASFQGVWDGVKLAELRRNDRDYQAGDTLTLREWQPDITGGTYTGRMVRRRIIDVADVGNWAPGYVLLSIEPL